MFYAKHIDDVKGIYVHVPFCDGKCNYCSFYSVRYNTRLADRYLAALERELSTCTGIAPETIYIGGGTPSMLSIQQIGRLCDLICCCFPFGALKEWSVEMNPATLTGSHGSLQAKARQRGLSVSSEKLSALVRAGVNRISLGAQSFNNNVLKWLGRRHSVADILSAVDVIRASGIENLGLDLIACVPGFSGKSWEQTLQQTITLGPEHISVYALTEEEGTRLSHSIGGGETTMLTDTEQLEALDAAEELLTSAGYLRYEISNYAKPGFECLHNLSCWRGRTYLGLGPAAASHAGLKRWKNRPDIAGYLDALEHNQPPPSDMETLTPELKTMELLIFGLRMAEGVSLDLVTEYGSTLQTLRKEGLVVRQNNRWMFTPRGRNLADAVAVELIRHGPCSYH